MKATYGGIVEFAGQVIRCPACDAWPRYVRGLVVMSPDGSVGDGEIICERCAHWAQFQVAAAAA